MDYTRETDENTISRSSLSFLAVFFHRTILTLSSHSFFPHKSLSLFLYTNIVSLFSFYLFYTYLFILYIFPYYYRTVSDKSSCPSFRPFLKRFKKIRSFSFDSFFCRRGPSLFSNSLSSLRRQPFFTFYFYFNAIYTVVSFHSLFSLSFSLSFFLVFPLPFRYAHSLLSFFQYCFSLSIFISR